MEKILVSKDLIEKIMLDYAVWHSRDTEFFYCGPKDIFDDLYVALRDQDPKNPILSDRSEPGMVYYSDSADNFDLHEEDYWNFYFDEYKKIG